MDYLGYKCGGYEPMVIDNYGDLQLVKVTPTSWCVRITKPAWFGFGEPSIRFFALGFNRTDMTSSELIDGYTLGDFKEALRVFNANQLKMGWKR